jgi:hypothetical protein
MIIATTMYFTKFKNKTLLPIEDQHCIFNFSSIFSFIKRDNFIAGKTIFFLQKNHKIAKNHRQKNLKIIGIEVY